MFKLQYIVRPFSVALCTELASYCALHCQYFYISGVPFQFKKWIFSGQKFSPAWFYGMVQKKLKLLPTMLGHFWRNPWFEAPSSLRLDCSIDEESQNKTAGRSCALAVPCDRWQGQSRNSQLENFWSGPGASPHVPILSFPLLHTRADVYLVGLCSEGRMDPHKEPEIRLLQVCLILRWLLSFRFRKESFIGAVCRHANQYRPQANMKTALCCKPFLTQSSPTIFGHRKSKPRQRNCVQCVCSVTEPLGHLRSHRQCIKHLLSPEFPKPAFFSASLRDFFLRSFSLPRYLLLCSSYV